MQVDNGSGLPLLVMTLAGEEQLAAPGRAVRLRGRASVVAVRWATDAEWGKHGRDAVLRPLVVALLLESEAPIAD